MPRKALLLGRNDDHSLRWCCNYDDSGADRHGLSPCDVRKIRNALEHHGYKVTVVGPDCRTEGQIIDAVKDAVRDCAEEDHFLFYFSGHSLFRDGELEMVLARGGRYTESLRSSRLIGLLKDDCCAAAKLLILDTCYAQGVTEVWQPKRYDKLRILVSTKTLVRGKEVDGLDGGIFTHCLCEALTESDYWRLHSSPEPLVDDQGHIYSDKLLRWLKWRIAQVAQQYCPGEAAPEPTGDGGQDEPFLVAQVAIPVRYAVVTGYPPEVLQSLNAALGALGVGRDLAAVGYAYCRSLADSDLLPLLTPIDSLHQVLGELIDPGRYYFAGNRLKLPLMSFVAHLSKDLSHPEVLERWLADTSSWLIERGAIAATHVKDAAAVVERPATAPPQSFLMVQVAPDLAAPPGSYSVAWDYIDEYGEPRDACDPRPGLRTHEDIVARILAAVRALPSRTPCKPQIEVLLPFPLLADEAFVDTLERALFRPGERPPTDRLTPGDLAVEFPLVLRCWERWFEPLLVNSRGGTDARTFWHDNADCLTQDSKPPGLSWLKVQARHEMQCAALLHLRDPDPGRRALALGCSGPIQRPELAALLDIGVPILLWPRRQAPTMAGLKALKKNLVCRQAERVLHALPRALYQYRCHAAAHAGAYPGGFSLLWEDPNRPIFDQPDYDNALMG